MHRLVPCLILLALLAPVAPAVGQIALDANFENGSENFSYSSSGGTYTVSPGVWLRFRANNVLGQAPQFRLANDNGSDQYRSYHRMVYSYDGLNWNYMDTGSKPGDGYYYFSNSQPFTQNEVQIAYWFPYTYTQAGEFFDRVQGSPFVQDAGIRGTSVQGRNLYGFQITDPGINDEPKEHIVLVARQHGYESLGNHVVEGLVDFLLSDAPQAVSLRQKAVVHVYPMANPDAVYNGRARENVTGSDLNRDWNRFSPSTGGTPSDGKEVDVLRNAIMAETGGEAAFLIDFHSHAKGSMGDGWYWNGDNTNSGAVAFTNAVWSIDQADYPDTPFVSSGVNGTLSGSPTASSWGYAYDAGTNPTGTLGGLGFTLEPTAAPFGQNRELWRIKAFGVSIAKAFDGRLGGFLVGDADLDGEVSLADLAALASHWNGTGGWADGDFNGDGDISLADLAMLAANWNAGVAGNPAMAFDEALAQFPAVPEPVTGLLLAAGALLLRRRR